MHNTWHQLAGPTISHVASGYAGRLYKVDYETHQIHKEIENENCLKKHLSKKEREITFTSLQLTKERKINHDLRDKLQIEHAKLVEYIVRE